MRDHIDELIDDIDEHTHTIKPFKLEEVVTSEERAEFARRLSQAQFILPTHSPYWDLVIS